MIRKLAASVLLLLTIFAFSAPLSQAAALTPSSHSAAVSASHADSHAALFDKTRVVFHLAIAWGAFHHWVWKPYKAGNLSLKHPVNLIKAGAALLFSLHEIKKAYAITSKSNSATLKALNTVLVAALTKFESVGNLFHKPGSSLTDAQVTSAVNDLNSTVDSATNILPTPDAPLGSITNVGN